MRQSVWSSLESSEVAVGRLESRVVRAAHRHDVISVLNRGFSIAAVAAACILFGFTVGWMGREKYLPGSPQDQNNPMVQTVARNTGVGNGSLAAGLGAHGNGKFVVEVRDDSGNVVAVPQFESIEEARQFATDIQQVQANRQQVHEPVVVPAALDRF